MTTSCAINAADFSRTMTDTLRTRWTAGKMRHLVAALDGAQVGIVVDAQTGHTAFGVLEKVCHSDFDGSVRVLVVTEHNRTRYRLDKIGNTIIPLPGANANGVKWTALRSYGDEQSAAIRKARADHGDVEGRSWGKWTATPGEHNVTVTYEPHTGNPAYADQWGERGYWTYPLAELRVAA